MHSLGHAGDGPQTSVWATATAMMAARRWLVASPDKVPHYLSGRARGATDTPDDLAQLGSYEDAKAVVAGRPGWMLGFALGPDGGGGHWQGIDLDHIRENGLADLANAMPGYVEKSPSGEGAHAIGYGEAFPSLGSNASGIEAYARGRYFTVTEEAIRDTGRVCLAPYIAQVLTPRHGTPRATAQPGGVEVIAIDDAAKRDLRSALLSMRADDYHLWVRIGHALRELGDVGRALWMEWSASSDKFDAGQAAGKWDGFNPTDTGHQAVFAEAQRHGWLNPASNTAKASAAKPGAAALSKRQLVGRLLGGVAPRSIDWLWVGWIPKGYITIFAGETGAGKSTVLADVTARVTTGAPWPGDGPEERREPGRVLWLGSEDSIEEMTVPRLLACGANLDNVIEIQCAVQEGQRNTFSMQDDLEGVAEWLAYARDVDNRPFAMLVIDPVTSYLPGQKLRKVDLNDAGQLRTVLEPWLVLAQKYHVAIVCVTHFAKDTNRSMLHRVLGSAAFAQTCRSLCAVVEPPSSGDDEPGPFEKALIQVKVNLPEHPGGAWRFSTEVMEVGADERSGKPITATRPNWDQLDGALTPKTAVGGSRGPKSQQAAPFALWINFQFNGHPPGTWLPVETIKGSAVREGMASESWWNKHSPEYLEKANHNGTWMCRLRQVPDISALLGELGKVV